MNKTQIIRQPRPSGLTYLSKKYQQTQDEEHYQELTKHFINYYINNNFCVNGTYHTIDHFTHIYGLRREDVQAQMLNASKFGLSQMIDPTNQEKIQGLIRVVLQWAFEGALEDRAKVAQQLSILEQAQQGRYTPFVSAEVNKALKLLLDSSKGLRETIGTLTGGSGSSMATLIPNSQQAQTDEGLTADQALELLSTHQPKQLKPGVPTEQIEDLYHEHNIEDTPEVSARGAEDDNTNIPQHLNVDEALKASEDAVQRIPKSSKAHHEDRRAVEWDLDLDEHVG